MKMRKKSCDPFTLRPIKQWAAHDRFSSVLPLDGFEIGHECHRVQETHHTTISLLIEKKAPSLNSKSLAGENIIDSFSLGM